MRCTFFNGFTAELLMLNFSKGLLVERFVSLLFLICLTMASTSVYADEIGLSNTPDWVVRQSFSEPAKIPETQISDGIYYMLLDRQVRVGRKQTDRFSHVVKKVFTPQGVENASQIYINFDPSYEKLSLHCIKIHRDGQYIDQLALEKLTVFQRESDLELRLYNGQKTASIILEDTRPGDIIEYAYTLSGRNPVFEDRYMFEGDTGWSVPIGALCYRWIFTNGRRVMHKTLNCRRKLVRRTIANGVEYLYKDKDVGAILIDENLPEWYFPYPSIQISQFRNWAEVADWGADLYQIPRKISSSLEKQIEKIKRCATSTEKIAKALCLVQNDIRYLGIEIGAGSYQPTAPDVTYQRKFGDCKDKSILLCTILNQLGIRAKPALVNTRLAHTIDDHLPSPLLFNHAIVWVASSGKIYWIDPTSDCQVVPMDQQYQALYGKALIIEKGVQALTDTGQEILSEPSREIFEEFDLTAGVKQPALLTIKTILKGREADRLRYQIKSSSLQQTAKSYLNFYASNYPSITERQSLRVEDNFETNTLVINEYYRIPDFWQQSEDQETLTAAFHCTEFSDLIRKPKTTIRSMPIGVAHPQYIAQRTTVKLPESWDIEQEQGAVENSALRFTYDIAYAETVLALNYTYRTKQDFVAADKATDYIADLNRIKNQIGYWLTWSDQAPDPMRDLSWFLLGATLIGLVAALGLGFFAWRYDPLPLQNIHHKPDNPALKGFGGWLILVMIGLFVRPVIICKTMADLFPAFKLSFWFDIQERVRPGFDIAFKALVSGEVAVNIILIALNLMLLYLFFKKRTAFPYLFIAVILGDTLIVLIDTFLSSYLTNQTMLDPKESSQMVRGAVTAVIWCMYMLKSVRVRQTFQTRKRPRITQFSAAALDPQDLTTPAVIKL
jgi:transglutaminase-like putative cysteine protease